ncbi:MAG: DUF1697 domain-containing protein [Longimicrobiales bacterium]
MKSSSKSTRHVALLRGINVGGNNIIKMVDLRVCFEAIGYADVATYIQSGNVVFSAKPADRASIISKIEKALDKTFGYESRIVLVSASEFEAVVRQAPAQFGTQPDDYRYDVLFLKEPLTAGEALQRISTKPGVDQAHAGDHALYFRRLISKAEQSHLTRLIQQPMYKSITIRNWNTTTRLLEMLA